jgi:hypothetical protein
MQKIAVMHSGTNANAHPFELLSYSGFRIIINSFKPIFIEMHNAVRFASQRENNYK